MDKKKVIEMIEDTILMVDTIEGFDDGDTEQLLNVRRKLNDALEELSKSDWISVEEDLPDIDEKVLVCNEKIPYMWWDSSISSDVADIWKDEHGFLKEDHITHWRKIDKLEV